MANAIERLNDLHERRLRELLGGYTHEELTDAFERVQEEGDWRAPINRAIVVTDDAEREKIKFAINFFTATKAHAMTVLDQYEHGKLVHFRARGYRMGPAGDH